MVNACFRPKARLGQEVTCELLPRCPRVCVGGSLCCYVRVSAPCVCMWMCMHLHLCLPNVKKMHPCLHGRPAHMHAWKAQADLQFSHATHASNLRFSRGCNLFQVCKNRRVHVALCKPLAKSAARPFSDSSKKVEERAGRPRMEVLPRGTGKVFLFIQGRELKSTLASLSKPGKPLIGFATSHAPIKAGAFGTLCFSVAGQQSVSEAKKKANRSLSVGAKGFFGLAVL